VRLLWPSAERFSSAGPRRRWHSKAPTPSPPSSHPLASPREAIIVADHVFEPAVLHCTPSATSLPSQTLKWPRRRPPVPLSPELISPVSHTSPFSHLAVGSLSHGPDRMSNPKWYRPVGCCHVAQPVSTLVKLVKISLEFEIQMPEYALNL
jgi:hypothetical protein